MERRQTPEADNKPSPDFVYNIANTCCHPSTYCNVTTKNLPLLDTLVRAVYENKVLIIIYLIHVYLLNKFV